MTRQPKKSVTRHVVSINDLTNKEIEQLLHATLHMPLSPHCPVRISCALLPWVYYCLFGLLSVTCLRLGEESAWDHETTSVPVRLLHDFEPVGITAGEKQPDRIPVASSVAVWEKRP